MSLEDLDVCYEDDTDEVRWELIAAEAIDLREFPVFKNTGSQLVLEPEAGVASVDPWGAPTSYLQFRLRPYVPASSEWLVIFAIDIDLTVTVAVSTRLTPSDSAGIVEVLHPTPLNAWVLTDEESLLTLMMVVIERGGITCREEAAILEELASGEYGISEILEFLEWSLPNDHIDVLLYSLDIDDCSTMLELLGWN